MTFDAGFEELQRLINAEKASTADGTRNEAQTRFDLIDSVLKDVLQWPASAIRVEEHVETGYTDYELVDVGTIAVVEAKREGVAFSLPTDFRDGVCAIAPLVQDRSNSALKSAMIQVMQYANARGTSPCVVTNGHQWVAFLGSRNDGVPPLEGKALVFPSLESLAGRYVTFFESLSLPGLRQKKLFSELSVGVPAPPAPLSAAIPGYPGIRRRNTVQSNLQIMGQVMLEDMPQEEQYAELFLKECYATSGALSSYAEVSRELLTSRNAALLSDLGSLEEPATTRRGINPALSTESLAAAASHRPIVLLGGVGVGKSTFIQHLVRVDARSVFQDALAILVDYGRGATFSSPADYAVERIRDVLLEEYDIDIDEYSFTQDLYRRDLDRFDKSPLGQLKDIDPTSYGIKRLEFLDGLIRNRPEHLKRSIARISKSRRRQVVIFLDNVDQRDHDDQNRVFLTANELAASWDATVFVTLRPETYYESQRYGAVSGYHPRVFSIAPPRSDVMLQKRIDFALRVLTGAEDARTSSGGVTLQSESLELFLKVLEHNFKRNKPLMSLIDNLAGGNMRRALDFVTQFIGSGHVDTDKIIGVERREPGDYFIPLHEFLRSLLHGDGEYYDPLTSPIANLFSIDRPSLRNHFLLPLTLDYVLSRGDAQDSAGFVDLSEVYRHLQGFGFSLEEIAFALEYAARFRLVEAPLADFRTTTSDRLRITTVGVYSLRYLPRLFTYCDAVVVDTPILDSATRSSLAEARALPDRLVRVQSFKYYLDAAWSESGFGSDGWTWSEVSTALQSDIDTVRARMIRGQGNLS